MQGEIAAPPVLVYRLLLEECTQVGQQAGDVATHGEWPEEGSVLTHRYGVCGLGAARTVGVRDPPRHFRIRHSYHLGRVRLYTMLLDVELHTEGVTAVTPVYLYIRTRPAFLGPLFARRHRRAARALLLRATAACQRTAAHHL